MSKSIQRLLVSAFIVFLMGIAFIPPANAQQINAGKREVLAPNSSATNVEKAKISKFRALLSPTFDPTLVRFGITPTGWSNSDDLTIDLVPPIPYQQILSEMALAGFKGSQGAPKFPKDINVLKQELELRGLKISEPWVGTYFTIGGNGKEESKRIFREQMEFMKEMGGNTIVVAELGGAVHQQPIDPLTNRPIFTDEQWQDLTEGLNEIGRQAHEQGMQLCYHPHVGTGVETGEDIDRLMSNTNPDYVKLLLDTGHLYYVGTDPLTVAKKYATRIKHVHLKNIRQNILDESKLQGRSFLSAIREGVFTVPGDYKGAIAFRPILQELANVNYEGWLMVEAEQDPNKANPLKYALMARSYLKDLTGF
ncbi:myo-inosose-2 dehydratase [Gloeothece verrucosa]|uniref:Myo-inosose-2 dehydratase n=1 Tax=Gloeothece verrucosa (strain PCC 7822) TaxID=497965 RepID=E0UKN6_GLOV7|nr:myo-inosose-2 dehydratase [Gloeothece verrucosa]ADN17516.1 Myo-inosose-2 dehydratase [Gloeothece verrucosa PCC 7822]